MKYVYSALNDSVNFVAPCAGAGIEICHIPILVCVDEVAPCAGAGIEISSMVISIAHLQCRPLRGGGD